MRKRGARRTGRAPRFLVYSAGRARAPELHCVFGRKITCFRDRNNAPPNFLHRSVSFAPAYSMVARLGRKGAASDILAAALPCRRVSQGVVVAMANVCVILARALMRLAARREAEEILAYLSSAGPPPADGTGRALTRGSGPGRPEHRAIHGVRPKPRRGTSRLFRLITGGTILRLRTTLLRAWTQVRLLSAVPGPRRSIKESRSV